MAPNPWGIATTLKPQPVDPADVLGRFLTPGDGTSYDANTPLELARLRSQQDSELSDRVAADPQDRHAGVLLSFLRDDETEDPYTGKQAQADTAYLSPEQTRLRTQKSTEAAQGAEATARATATGTAEGQNSPDAQAVADAASQRKINEAIAPTRALYGDADSGGGSDVINTLAEQYRNDPTYPVPPHLKDAVAARAASMGSLDPRITNQTRQMSEGATDILQLLPEATQLAQSLKSKGLFAPVIGSARTMLAGHGLSTLAGVDDQTAQDISRFNSLVEGIKSGFARAHAGARGAGNKDLVARFDKLVPVQGDFPSFIGGLQGMSDILTQYAGHTHPGTTNPVDPWAAPPTAAELGGQ